MQKEAVRHLPTAELDAQEELLEQAEQCLEKSEAITRDLLGSELNTTFDNLLNNSGQLEAAINSADESFDTETFVKNLCDAMSEDDKAKVAEHLRKQNQLPEEEQQGDKEKTVSMSSQSDVGETAAVVPGRIDLAATSASLITRYKSVYEVEAEQKREVTRSSYIMKNFPALSRALYKDHGGRNLTVKHPKAPTTIVQKAITKQPISKTSLNVRTGGKVLVSDVKEAVRNQQTGKPPIATQAVAKNPLSTAVVTKQAHAEKPVAKWPNLLRTLLQNCRPTAAGDNDKEKEKSKKMNALKGSGEKEIEILKQQMKLTRTPDKTDRAEKGNEKEENVVRLVEEEVSQKLRNCTGTVDKDIEKNHFKIIIRPNKTDSGETEKEQNAVRVVGKKQRKSVKAKEEKKHKEPKTKSKRGRKPRNTVSVYDLKASPKKSGHKRERRHGKHGESIAKVRTEEANGGRIPPPAHVHKKRSSAEKTIAPLDLSKTASKKCSLTIMYIDGANDSRDSEKADESSISSSILETQDNPTQPQTPPVYVSSNDSDISEVVIVSQPPASPPSTDESIISHTTYSSNGQSDEEDDGSSVSNFSTLTASTNGTFDTENLNRSSESEAVNPDTDGSESDEESLNATCNIDLDAYYAESEDDEAVSGSNMQSEREPTTITLNDLVKDAKDSQYEQFKDKLFVASSPKPAPRPTKRKILPDERDDSSDSSDESQPQTSSERKKLKPGLIYGPVSNPRHPQGWVKIRCPESSEDASNVLPDLTSDDSGENTNRKDPMWSGSNDDEVNNDDNYRFDEENRFEDVSSSKSGQERTSGNGHSTLNTGNKII